jgi:DASH complex subunit DAD1
LGNCKRVAARIRSVLGNSTYSPSLWTTIIVSLKKSATGYRGKSLQYVTTWHVLTAFRLSHQGFEELLSSTNVLNRKLEEVLGMTKEYDTIAALWSSFYQLMSAPADQGMDGEEWTQGLPGTGTHIVVGKQGTNRTA